MASTSDVIPLLFVTDEHYVIHLAALLKSIEINHKTGEKIVAYIIVDGVKASSRRRIQESLSAEMFELIWVEMEAVIPSGITIPFDRTSFPLTTYMRLFIQHVVPAGTRKALFLDVDMLLLEDISALYNHELGESVLAAVQDPRIVTVDNSWGGVLNYKELGLAPDTKYFNAGLILFNVTKWAALGLTEKVIDCINQNTKFANYAEQYGLNVVLANQWQELDPRWNYFSSGDLPHPYLIHFTSRKPFYTSYSSNPAYQKLFYEYLDQTKWRGTKPVGEVHRYAKKINNILVKVRKSFKL